MTYLVTGGCGFIGSHFIRHILATEADAHVINLDALTYAGNPKNLSDIAADPRYTFVHGSITDRACVEKILSEHDIDVIVNYAAETHVDRSILDARSFVETDVFGTYTLLEAAKAHGIKKYIQISTDEVFGSIEEGAFVEESPFEPNSPYSASKAGADLLCRAYVKTYGFPVMVTHACNIYGPNQYPEKVIPFFVTNLLEGKKVPLYGVGAQIREWLYVTDHAHAVRAIIEHGKFGEVYNIGSGDRISNKELTDKIIQSCGKTDADIEYVTDRLGHDQRYAIDCTKLRALGWTPTMSFADGLSQTIRWYQDNPGWWQPLKR